MLVKWIIRIGFILVILGIIYFGISSYLNSDAAFAAVSDDATIQNAQLVSQDDKVTVDKQVMIMADLSNGQDRDQKFAYIVPNSKSCKEEYY